MNTRSFVYYGYSKESYRECTDLIRSTNRKHIAILNTWFAIINLIYLVFSYLNLFGVNEEKIPLYGVYFCTSLVFEVWLLFFPKKVEKHNYFAVFFIITFLLSFGIITSIASPYMPATFFLVLLVLTSLSFMGNMWIMISFTIVSVSIFLLTSYQFKTFSIAYYDTYNGLVISTLAIALHYTFQRTRVSQFILYKRDLQIQKELEIKSSFDALTGLLNRGRFFSIADIILRQKHTYKALCLLDLDGFKQVNDNLGHQMGDKVIQTVGRTIIQTFNIPEAEKSNISSWNLTADFPVAGRLGGDEFIILLHTQSGKKEVVEVLQKVLDSLNAVRFDRLEGIHASFGVTEILPAETDIDNAYKRADEALYESKRAGKNQIHFSTETLPGDA